MITFIPSTQPAALVRTADNEFTVNLFFQFRHMGDDPNHAAVTGKFRKHLDRLLS